MEDVGVAQTRQQVEPTAQEMAGDATQTHEQIEEYPDEETETDMVVQVDNTPTKHQPRRSQRVYSRESTKEALDSLN